MFAEPKRRVVYLFGAGASHACVKAIGGAQGILMRDLTLELSELLQNTVYRAPFSSNPSLMHLVNEVITESTDLEHIITFLDESNSALHRQFANELRVSFETVLRKRLAAILHEFGDSHSNLYMALLDMYEVEGFPEILEGCLTLNYDGFLETAISRFGDRHVDYGICVEGVAITEKPTRVLKLHGSFSWEDVWPVRLKTGDSTLWIPPGIQKAKERYPFNALWGLARELLNCDVLRIVGCSLGPNDWDLVSLLFSTRHVNEAGRAYEIELIDSPARAHEIQRMFPYLEIRSILDVEPVGSQLVAEFGGGDPRPFRELDERQRQHILGNAGEQNWFLLWLSLMAETSFRDLGSVSTPWGAFERVLEEYV